VSSLSNPFIDSRDILEYLDSQRMSGHQLLINDTVEKERAQQLIDLVHSQQVGTDLILVQACNKTKIES